MANVVTGLTNPDALVLDVGNDRLYFSQTSPNRISYALLSNPASVLTLVSPLSTNVYAGGLERDPTAGTLGELYIALSGASLLPHAAPLRCPSARKFALHRARVRRNLPAHVHTSSRVDRSGGVDHRAAG